MAEKANLNIYQRMILVQKAVKSVVKNEVVKMFENDRGYKAVTHDDVAALLHMPLAEAGIVLLPDVTEYQNSDFELVDKYGKLKKWYRTDIKIRVRWINADKPDEFIESTGGAFALDSSDKSFAKAYSLALKIVLLKVHLLESRDQEEERILEDGNAPPPPKVFTANKPFTDRQSGPKEKPKEDDLDVALGNRIPPTKLELLQNDLYSIVDTMMIPEDEVKKIIKLYAPGKNSKTMTEAQLEQVIKHIDLTGGKS